MKLTGDLQERLARLSPAQRAVLEARLKQAAPERKAEEIIPRRLPGQPVPATFSQQQLWFFEQLHPGTPTYNVPEYWRLRGELNAAALERALQELVQRHEILRTVFVSENDQPLQVVREPQPFQLAIVDLQSVPAAEREARAQQLADAESATPFDLTTGPLFRAQLLRLGSEEHWLLLNGHHIVTDGWSSAVIQREISEAYGAFVAGRQPQLPVLPVQYGDFAAWEEQWLEREVFPQQLEYWRNQLAGAPALIPLPTDHPRPTVATQRGEYESATLPKETLVALQALSRKEGATSFMTFLALSQVLLMRYTGQNDIIIGTASAGRDRPELQKLVGFFVNMLALRLEVNGQWTFRELLHEVKAAALATYANQDLPFEKLVQELQPARSAGHNPVFQVALAHERTDEAAWQLAGLTVSPLTVPTHTTKFDLSLAFLERPANLEVGLGYRLDLFEAPTIRRMLGHLCRLIEGVVADPDQRLADLPLLTEPERQQLLHDWNRTQADHPRDQLLHQLIEAQAEKTPDAVAVIYEGAKLSYRELDARANQLAHHLRSLGVQPDTLVGLCLERSLEMVVGLLGVLKAGGAYVPIDPAYPAERIAFMITDAQMPVLLTQEKVRDALPANSARIVCLDADWPVITKQPAQRVESKLSPEHLAYVIYTSGSTGKPKGVMIPHRAIVNHMYWLQRAYPLGTKDAVFQKTPFSFDASVWEFYAPLMVGGRLVVAKPQGHLDSAYMARTINEHQVTTLQLVPSLLRMLLAEPAFANCKTLKRVFCGGEALTLDLQTEFFATLPQATLHNLYGPTEAAIDSTSWDCVRSTKSATVPIGRPVDNATAYVVDAGLKLTPVGVPGELLIGGAGLARGYFNRPELTAEKFIANPFGAGRVYRTGDLARWLPDGTIEFLGRVDHQVKLRGFRIELGEIEAALEQLEDVAEAAVVVREVRAGDQRLVGYCSAHNGSSISVPALREQLRARLPEYMVPAQLVVLDKLPHTPNGKIDRRALPSPEMSVGGMDGEFVAAGTPTEERLAALWSEVLGLPRVSVLANFFELGGHSLLAVKLMARVRREWNRDVPLRLLFEHSTITSLARVLDGANGVMPVVVIPRRGADQPVPLAFSQQQLWFFEQLHPGTPTYNVPEFWRLRGPLNRTALDNALTELVRRHEILRTIFVLEGDKPLQLVRAPHPIKALVTDLEALPAAEREARAQRLADEEAATFFDLSAGPLFRVRLLRLAPEEHWLLINAHHTVTDGWSSGVLRHDLAELYAAFVAGRKSRLPELPLQYGDFAVWQDEWLKREVFPKQLDYWRQQLAGAPEVIQLPADRPRPKVATQRGDETTLVLPQATLEALRTLSRAEGATTFMTVLALTQAWLARCTGQESVVIGTPAAGREAGELQRLIGFFVNMLALRLEVDAQWSFRELLRRAKAVALAAYAHQDLPFEKLVQVLHPRRSAAYNPVFQIALLHARGGEESWPVPGLQTSPLTGHTGTTKFDLTIHFSEETEGLRLSVSYSLDLFDAATIERLLRQFQNLITAAVANPELRLAELPMLTAAERRQLLVDWNRTQTDFPRERCIHELFEEQVANQPGAVALELGDVKLTYGQLNERANRLAHQLRAAGVGPDTLVTLCVERSLELVVALIAILKAGGAYVPLSPDYPRERLAFMLADTQSPVVLTQRHLVSKLPKHDAQVVLLDARETSLTDNRPVTNPVGNARPENLAYVMYTSGSTGQPKGTTIPHRAVVRLVKNTNFATLSDQEVFLQFAPVSFDASTLEIWGPLLNGGRLVIMPPGGASLEELGRVIERHRVTTLWLTAGLFNVMVDDRLNDLKNLRQLLAGGDVLSVPHVKKALAGLPGCRLINGYGPTENTTFTCCHTITAADGDGAGIPIGRPIANTQVFILDAQMQPVPIGVPGELFVGGDGLARDYLNRPELTQEKFVPHPFSEVTGARLYRTGDLCRYRADGVIEFLGRMDQQVKIRGFRIELEEIETALKQHPGVREAVVVARDFGAGDKRLVAYFVANTGGGANADSLREHLRTRLPEYMAPATFVPMEALPLNPNGKVDRKALPAPAVVNAEPGALRVMPRTPIEEVIAATWAEVLGVDRVGVLENFFSLGGHSLQTIQIIDRLSRAGLGLTLDQMLQHQTVAELAAVVDSNRAVTTGPDEWSSLVTLQPRGERPPFFLIHTAPGDVLGYMKLVYYLGSDQPVYGFQSLGLSAPEKCHRTIPEMAAHYVKLLREFQPNGPYYIGGWCFGGNVAMEMAHQLAEQGQQVALLALMETWAHKPPLNCWRYYVRRMTYFQRMGLIRGTRHYWGRLARLWRRRRSTPENAVAVDNFAFEATHSGPLKNREKIYPINLRATNQHRSRPEVYPGRVTLFFRETYGVDLITPDWDFDILAREVKSHMVPGDHRSVLKDPQVRRMAELLKAELVGAQDASRGNGHANGGRAAAPHGESPD